VPPFIRTVQNLVADPPGWVLVGELQRVVTVPLDVDHGDERLRENAPNGDVRPEIFERH
jgi:hypothetical protein